MITAVDYWKISSPGAAPMAASYGPRASVDRWALENPALRGGCVIEAVPHCLCCGSLDVCVEWPSGWRCKRHLNSVPCQIEGCKRTSARERVVGSEWICSTHWRAGVPPRSPARRVFSRFKRLIRRFGSNPEREARGDRLWAWLKARCEAAARGDLDQREVDRLFGWD